MGEPVEQLHGQVALVTGAGRGIGRELAVGLARAGMNVGLVGRTRATLDDALRACAMAGAKAVAVPADVTRRDGVRAAVSTVERDLGPIDLLVNSAGLVDPAEVRAWEADPDAWWRVVEVNLRGPFLLCHAVLPGMVSRGAGRLVNLNSGMGTRPVPAYSAYSVSKAALMHLSDNLAEPLTPYGVRVFDLSPGTVQTDMTASMPMLRDREAWMPAERVVDAVVAIAGGHLDPLAGRFIHIAHDDLETLLARAAQITAVNARTLRLRPYGPDDPLA
ncbi:MAG: SDR family NAD(P)-dependent oxidoreductase [Carbonactinosporaceae bacterium]